MARFTPLLWFALTCTALPGMAAAQSEANGREQASIQFDRGLELIVKGAYAEAVIEFERAYQLSGDAAVLYNLGMAYAAADRPVEAAAALARYLEQSRALADDERTRVAAEIERQHARIGDLAIAVEPAGTQIRIDGRELGVTPLPSPLPLAVGDHRIEGTKAGYESASWVVRVAGRQHHTLLMALQPVAPSRAEPSASSAALPAPRTLPNAAPTVATSDADGSTQRVIGYTLGGVGIAAGIAAAALAAVSADRFDDWEAEHTELGRLRAATDPETEQRRQDNDALLKSVWQMDALTWALGIGSGALLAGSVAVLWTAPDSDRMMPTARVSLRGSGVAFDARF